jgi:RNA polymerase sigma factor (sigma-70 family)
MIAPAATAARYAAMSVHWTEPFPRLADSSGVELIQSSGDSADGDVARSDFLAWIDPHLPMMRRVAWRLARANDAEDVLQNAVLAAWRHRDGFDDARGTAGAWLATVTVNEARKSRRSWRPPEPIRALASGIASEVSVDLHRAMRRLPKRQALAVQLYYYVGLPIRDIAVAMGCAEGTVKSTLAAARTALHRLLGEDYW